MIILSISYTEQNPGLAIIFFKGDIKAFRPWPQLATLDHHVPT